MSLREGNETMQEIDITKLNLQQLSQLKQRLEQVNTQPSLSNIFLICIVKNKILSPASYNIIEDSILNQS